MKKLGILPVNRAKNSNILIIYQRFRVVVGPLLILKEVHLMGFTLAITSHLVKNWNNIWKNIKLMIKIEYKMKNY